MRSIQHRLSFGLILSLLIVGVCLLQSSLWLLESELRNTFKAHLAEEAEGLLSAMVLGAQGPQLEMARVNPRYRRAFSGYYFHIQLPNQVWRSRSLWDNTPDWPEALGLGEELIKGPQDQHLLTYRGSYRRTGQNIIVTVAQDYTPILHSFQRIRWISFLLVGAALLILLIVQRYVMASALRPLELARRQILQLQRGQRQKLDTSVPDELQPLVEQINHLLAHTDVTLKRSRNALGNLGHALKTPLAVLNTLIQHEELRQHPALQASLKEQLKQIQQRVSLELNRARLATDVLPGSHFDCQDEVPALLKTLNMIHGTQINLSWLAPKGCQLPRDREDMLELLGNLLDNACKWAKSQVHLEIQPTSLGYRLTVDDDGPGIAPEQRQQAMQRGARLDERPSGHGLGLDIVGDIISAWNGQWMLEQSPWGGLRVRIELPGHLTKASQ